MKLFALVVLLVLISPAFAVAAEDALNPVTAEKMIAYPYPSMSPGDYYQVMFDAEGEATVLALLARMNTGAEQMDKIVVQIPGRSNIRYVFQEVQTCSQQCVNYQQQCVENEVVCSSWNKATSTCISWEERCKRYDSVCTQWEERCSEWPKAYAPIKYDADPTMPDSFSHSTRYTFHLSQPIKQTETGTILIYYKSSDYVHTLINYDFDFETAKGPYDIQYTRVAIATDSELYMRGGQARTDYVPSYSQFESYAMDASSGSAKSSEALSSYVSNVRYAQGYIKEKRSLDPWESFHVYGTYTYASLWPLAYFWEIVIVLVALILVRLFAWKRIYAVLAHAFGWKQKEKAKDAKGKETARKEGRFTRIAFAGLVSAISLLVVTWIIFTAMPQSYQFSYPFSMFFSMVSVIASGAVMIIVFLAPAIWMWKKFSLGEAVWTILASVIWLFILIALVGMFFYTSTDGGGIIPMYKSVLEGSTSTPAADAVSSVQ